MVLSKKVRMFYRLRPKNSNLLYGHRKRFLYNVYVWIKCLKWYMYPYLNDSLNYKYNNRIKESFSPRSNIDVPCLARCKLKFHSLSSVNIQNTWGWTDWHKVLQCYTKRSDKCTFLITYEGSSFPIVLIYCSMAALWSPLVYRWSPYCRKISISPSES